MGNPGVFERILDEKVAAALGGRDARRWPAGVALAPDPGVRFVAWGGGVPPSMCVHRYARPLQRSAGVSPWAGGVRPDPVVPQCEKGRPAGVRVGPPAKSSAGGDGPRRAWPRSRRVARLLDDREWQALEWLRRAGAPSLTERFTDTDLKATFRRLARRCHPDTQPGATERQRQQLAADFRQLTAACRLLRGALPPI